MSTDIAACKKGSEQTLYYNTGTADTPVWVEHVGMVEDLDLGETEELSELTGRRTGRTVKEYNEGEIELSITGTQIHDPAYEGWQYLNAARTGGTPQEFMVLSGKISEVGSYGWRGSFWNSDRSARGPASGDLVNAVNLQPAAPCYDEHSEARVVKVATADSAADFDPATLA